MAQPISPNDVPSSALSAPRFSLRTLLVGVSVLSLVFAVMAAVGVVWSAALVLVGCLIGAHVLGNSLGTRLRDESTRTSTVDRPSVVEPPVRLVDLPVPQLAEHAGLHRIALAVTLCAGAIGGELGAMLAAYTYPESSAAAIGLGAVSLAVVGGFAGFGIISFATIARRALRQAHQRQDGRD